MSHRMAALSIGVVAALGAGLVAILRLDRAVEAELRMGEEGWSGTT